MWGLSRGNGKCSDKSDEKAATSPAAEVTMRSSRSSWPMSRPITPTSRRPRRPTISGAGSNSSRTDSEAAQIVAVVRSAVVGKTGARYRDGRGVELSGTRPLRQPLQVVHKVLAHVPVGAQHEQRATLRPTEGARETALSERNPIEHLATPGYADAARPVVVPAGRPDRALGVHTDSVGQHLGEGPAVVEATVLGDVECCQLARKGLRDDQGRVVVGYCHPVREGNLPGDLTHDPVRSDCSDKTWRHALVGVEVVATIDIDDAVAVHDNLVQPAWQAAHIGVVDQ